MPDPTCTSPDLLERLGLPAPEQHSAHRRRIAAPPERVWHELTVLTLGDLRISRPLVALRHLGAPTPTDRPLLTEGPVQLLEQRPGYAVGGAVARPWQRGAPRHEVADLAAFAAFAEPGWSRYLTEFRVDPADDTSGGGSVLATRTLCWSTDAWARRRFVAYWALIRVGSELVRRDVLATVARKSERPH